MQVDAGKVLYTLDPTLRLMSESEAIGGEDEEKIEEERKYIIDLLEENHIQYDTDGDDFIVRGEQIPDVCVLFDLGTEQEVGQDDDGAIVDLNDMIGMVTAYLYLKFNDERVADLVSWLVEE